MQRRTDIRGISRQWRTALALAAGIALPAALGGCTTTASNNSNNALSAFAMAGPATAQSVAFESVDGPPQDAFQRLVQKLDDQAQARRIPVASRDGQAGYRVRAYLAAGIRGGRTVISWVWDVYDGERNRVLRLSGEEQGGRAGRDPWAAADDALMAKIAKAGLDGVASVMNGNPAGPSATPRLASAFADPRLD